MRRRLQRLEHVRDHDLDPDRGYFQIVAPRRQDRHQRRRVRVDLEEIVRLSRRRQRRRRKRLEHVPGRHRDAGIDQHRGQFRQGERIGQDARRCRASCAPSDRGRPARRRRSRCAASRTRASSSERSFTRASSRSAAAASDEPPPSPAATGSSFSSRKRPSRNPVDAFGERARRLEHEIVAARARRFRGRAGDVECERVAGSKRQPVADIGERHEAFELVIAVRPAAEHMQREIDLGGRERPPDRLSPQPPRMDQPPSPGFLPAFAVSAGCASSISPVRSFSLIFLRSSGSGLRSRACAHWNVASSVRPTFQ